MKKSIGFSFLLVLSLSMSAQISNTNCGTDLRHAHMLANDPDYQKNRAFIDQRIDPPFLAQKSGAQILIPVVVHVIHRLPEQDISLSQIKSQIDVLNKDFNKLNWDTMKVPPVWKSLIADCEIRFELANRDPNGNPTTGITRKQTSIQDIANVNGDAHSTPSKGGEAIWDRDRYLNIWVCEIQNNIYGFASFPGGDAASDGVVIDFGSFGTEGTATTPTEKGRTATHEIGHWLNLYHLWGTNTCGDDQVNDTPKQEKGNFDCPTFPSLSSACPNGPNGDMYMNYMDFTDDGCMNMFTLGQKARMLNTLNNERSSILSSNGYNGIDVSSDQPFQLFPNPSNDAFQVSWSKSSGFTALTLHDLSGKQLMHQFIDPGSQKINVQTDALDNGIYVIKLYSETTVFTDKVVVWHR